MRRALFCVIHRVQHRGGPTGGLARSIRPSKTWRGKARFRGMLSQSGDERKVVRSPKLRRLAQLSGLEKSSVSSRFQLPSLLEINCLEA